MLVQELFERVKIKVQQTEPIEVTGIALNADDVQKGFIFAALKGSQKDGVDFIPTAVEKGAVLIMAERVVDAPVPVVVIPNLRRVVSEIAAVLFPSDSVLKVAVTGTNGKTSTVAYVMQILNQIGITAGSIGTIGVQSPMWTSEGAMTTPDAVTLNKMLQKLADKGVKVVALETSSHGLHQGRTNGLVFEAGAFTNLTQDHLDYHKTMTEYGQAKSLLFSDCIRSNGVAVLNVDDESFNQMKQAAIGKRIISYGRNGTDIRLLSQQPTDNGQLVRFRIFDTETEVCLHLDGDFQVMNLFAAIGLCLSVGATVQQIIPTLENLTAPAGRMESIGILPNGAKVLVDYAHTPDAVERVLLSARQNTKGRLVCLLGCGGNRDAGKRPLMGAVADKLADVVYVTDDNPRFENPSEIRKAILQACPKGIECDNREYAIHKAVAELQPNDVLVLCGKGHEKGQTIQGVTYALDDRIEARLAVMKQQEKSLWTSDELKRALGVMVAEHVAGFGVSIDTRTIKTGDLFIALRGDKTDGHRYVRRAVECGAAVCVVERPVENVPADKQIIVKDSMQALLQLATFSRNRCQAKIIGVTGSSGKTTVKEMIKAGLSKQGKTHATNGNFNNQIGVPLTLARMPADCQFAVIEMGMNHSGELRELSALVKPVVMVITSIGSAHRAFFEDESDIAKAKAEIFEGQTGVAVLNNNCGFFEFLKTAAKQNGIDSIVSFGTEPADFGVKKITVSDEKTVVDYVGDGQISQMTLNFIGPHFVYDAMAALAAIRAVGGATDSAVPELEKLKPELGRGGVLSVCLSGRKITVIDDAYNANPASMAASLRAFACRGGRRKIVVIGDMLELGSVSEKLHLELVPDLINSGADKIYAVGPMCAKLFEKIPAEKQGKCVLTADEIIPVLMPNLQDGDVVLIKASHGTGLNKIIQAVKGESSCCIG